MIRECELRNIALQTAQMKRKSSFQNKQPKKKQKTDHSQIVSLKRDVRNLKLANETHVFDQNIQGVLSNTPISSTWPSAIVCLNCPDQGDRVNQRQGSQVKSEGFEIRLQVAFAVGQLDQTSYRVLVFIDKQNNATVTPVMLASVSNQGYLDNTTTTDVMNCPYLTYNSKRYRTLYDKRFVSNPTCVRDYDPVSGNSSSVSSRSIMHHIRIPWKGITEFNGANNITSADIQTNAVRFAIISAAPTNPGDFMAVVMASRFFFKEA